MISKLLTILLLAPLALLAVVFCVVNRQPVTLSMDALGTSPQFALEAPLFVWLLGFLIAGLILGGFGTWVGQARYRARASHREREAMSLRREVDARDAKLRRMREEEDRRRNEAMETPRVPVAPGLADQRQPGQAALAGPRAA